MDYPIEDNENTIHSLEKILSRMMKQFSVERIFTMNEYYIEHVARIAREYNIPYYGLNEDAAQACRNKKNTKVVFEKNKIPCANYVLIKSLKEALQTLNRISFPLVVKPSNESGSKLVSICDNIQEMIDSLQQIYSTKQNCIGDTLDTEVLVEEYIDGKEYSVETYTINGASTVIAITSKETENCIEVSHTVPAKISYNVSNEIKGIVISALKALNVRYGVTHTELKISSNGIKIIEVNGRVAGDNIYKLVDSVTGINLREVSLSIALDGSIENAIKKIPEVQSASIRYMTASKDGILTYDQEFIENSILNIDFNYKYGDTIKKTKDNFTRLGHFIIYEKDEIYSFDKVDEMLDSLKVEII
ncbi:ATP-grasp domain-containing protein [Anaerosporobacter sp.]